MARILVVDDEPDIRHIIRIVLEGDGHDVIEADDGLTAYEVAREQHLDLVLLDAMMPGMDGDQLLDKLLGLDDFAAPVIMVTGRSDAAAVYMEMDAGAIDHISKPFTTEELRGTVTRMLELSAEERDARRSMLSRSAATHAAIEELRSLGTDDKGEAQRPRRFRLSR
ncbi:MAG: response regulator [Actinomycetota bacterium]